MPQLPKGHKKLLRSWAFYDWANSVYPLVISSAVFPIFYGGLTIIKSNGEVIDNTVRFLGFDFKNDALISYVTALAFLVVSVLSPLLSRIVDYIVYKNIIIRIFLYNGSVVCLVYLLFA